MTESVKAIQTILATVEQTLRDRLKEIGADGFPHVLAVIGADGELIMLTNVDSIGLMDVATDLARAALRIPRVTEPIH